MLGAVCWLQILFFTTLSAKFPKFSFEKLPLPLSDRVAMTVVGVLSAGASASKNSNSLAASNFIFRK